MIMCRFEEIEQCVLASGTGKRHVSVKSKSCYTLCMDVTGPLRTKGRDAYGQGYRFGIVFAYVYPRLHRSLEAEAKPEEEGEHGRVEGAEKGEEDKEGMSLPSWKELFGDEEEGVDGDEKDTHPREANKDEEKTREEELATDTLYFFRPMKTKNAKEVFEKVKEVYLQLRNENLPVIRIHADRAHENYSPQLRSWATDRDIVITRTEGQDPAANWGGRKSDSVLEGKGQAPVGHRKAGPGALAVGFCKCRPSSTRRAPPTGDYVIGVPLRIKGAGEAQGVWSRRPV